MAVKWPFSSKPAHPGYQQALTEFSRSLTLIVDFDQLLENLEGKLKDIADIPYVTIFLQNHESHLYTVARHGLGSGVWDNVVFKPEDRLVQWLTVNEMPLVVEDNPGVVAYLTERERAVIASESIKLIVPLLVMNRVNGMVFIGPKSSGLFTKSEVDLLVTLLSQSALAFENALLYREQKQRLKKMFRSDRLATIGQIAAGAAHEIRNPLTSIRSTIQYLKKKEQDSERQEMMDELISEVDRIDEIIRGMLSFSKPVQPQKEHFDMNEHVRKSIALAQSTARRGQVDIRFTPLDEAAEIMADPQQLRQVFLNIILNAVQAMPQGGGLNVGIHTLAGEHGGRMVITFEDNGKGIPESDLEHIFDPFFTTKNDGTGLGLSISYGIIQQHGGEIDIQSSHGTKDAGTKISITLPRHERKSA